MIKVTFDDISYDAYLVSYQIGKAEVKKSSVDIPYSDGELDLTDYFGSVKYKKRPLTINMRILNHTLLDTFHIISGALNGKVKSIRFSDDDENWYWRGRLSVGEGKRNGKAYDFQITGDVDPYQYEDITIIRSFSAAGDIVCPNKEMITSPTIVTDAAITAVFGTTTVTLAAGEHYVSAFRFTEGNNTITITPTSSANVKILYTRGRQ